MKEHRLIKNYSFNLAFKMLDMVIPLITTPYLSRVLGDYAIGVFGYTNSIATFCILLASAGINLYGQREIAYVQNQISDRTRVFKEITLLKCLLVLIVGIGYWAIFSRDQQYGLLYRILVIQIVAHAFDISWFYQGMEQFEKTVVKNTVFRMLGVMAIFMFVKSEEDLPLYAILYSIPILLGNISLWFYLGRYLDDTQLHWKRISIHIAPVFALFIPQIAIEIYTVLDKTMLGGLGVAMEEVAYYEQAQKVVKIGLRFFTAFGAVMMSRVANAYAEEGQAAAKDNIAISVRFTLFLGLPILFGTMGIASSLVPWFFGDGFEPVTGLIICTAPMILAIGFSNIIGTQYLIPTGQHKIYTASVICGSIVNLCLNLLLIPYLQAWGASLASVAAEWMVTLVQLYLVRKQLDLLQYIICGWRYLISGGIMLVATLLVRQIISSDIFCTAIQIIVGGMVYIILLFVMKDEVAQKIKRIFHRGNFLK